MNAAQTALACFAVLVAACSEPPGQLTESCATLLSYEADCTQRGGRWTGAFSDEDGVCQCPTLDSGKSCTDSSDCQTACTAKIATREECTGAEVSGTCEAWTPVDGCFCLVGTRPAGIDEPYLCVSSN